MWSLTHVLKHQVNIFIVLGSDDVEQLNDIGMIPKLLQDTKNRKKDLISYAHTCNSDDSGE